MRKRWLGGYVRETSAGAVYIIERWQGGKRCHVSTRCTTERAALKELERFEADPYNYNPGGGADAVRMGRELVLEYRAHQVARGLTAEWADEVARCLADWTLAFGGRDIRSLNLHRDIRPALAKWKSRVPHRIKALKGFMRWLREERGLITRATDPTLDLRTPQARPEKWTRRKVVSPEDVAAVLAKLPQPTRDMLHLLTATAWHVSEVRRLASGGEIVRLATKDVLAVLIVRQKSGELTKTPIVYPEHLAAAERIHALRRLPTRMTTARHMQEACAAAGVPRFGLGQMRHSVLTWGVERGASIEGVAEFAHHRSRATTDRFYVDLAVPRTPVPILRLER